jgi:hypothetical protein
LNPPTPVDTTVADATPPPKITPNGIMSIFGQLQVLFKVAGTAKPGKPAVDDDYILSEGQRQDDIEVVKIDEKAGSVTFNNHGTVQELPLASTVPDSSGPVAGANPAPTATSLQPTPGGGTGFGERGGRTYGRTYGGRNGSYGNNAGNSSSSTGVNGDLGSSPYIRQPQMGQNAMTAEESIAITEVGRAATQNLVNNGDSPPLPPTDLTPSDAPGLNGGPLVGPPGPPPP